MDANLLSDREIEVLRLVGQGKSNKEIAMDLDISVNTVKVHIGNIFQKINVTSRTEATLFAIEHGIIKSPANQIEEEEQETHVTEIQETKPTWREILSQKRWLFIFLGLLIVASLYAVIAIPAFLKSGDGEHRHNSMVVLWGIFDPVVIAHFHFPSAFQPPPSCRRFCFFLARHSPDQNPSGNF